jgi:hypothetical protein
VRLRSWLRCLGIIASVEYGASLASDFDAWYLDVSKELKFILLLQDTWALPH